MFPNRLGIFYGGCVLTGLGVGCISLASREFPTPGPSTAALNFIGSAVHGRDSSSKKPWAVGRVLRNYFASWRGRWVLDKVGPNRT